MEFIKEYPVENLKEWDKNPRKNDVAADKLSTMIEEYGFVNPIIIDQHGTIRAGHTRLKAAKKLGQKTVPVLIYEFKSEAQAIGYAIADNKVSEIAEWDFGKLEGLMTELEEMDFDISLTGFDDMNFGNNGEKTNFLQEYTKDFPSKPLNKDFLIPPFSVLSTFQGEWKKRKLEWKAIIGDEGQTRTRTLSDNEIFNSYGNGVSVLDPVLSELVNLWFTPKPKDNVVVDCFAGDTVFGFVTGFKGNIFRGIEIRKEQCDFNNERTKNFDAKYFNDDGQNILNYIEEKSADLFFSCPPYFDLEVYSDLENDASNQKEYEEYLKILEKAFSNTLKCLNDNRFAVIVIGDVRNEKTGFYYDIIGDIVEIMKKNNVQLYNSLVLQDPVGRTRLFARRMMRTRKVPKVHQNILVFFKGDTKKIKEIFPEIEVQWNESEDLELQAME